MIYNFSAPAKINLGLEVLNKRDDNFHNIKTIFQFLDWGDEISLDTNTEETKIICSDLPQEENIIHKLLSILGEKNVFTKKIKIEVKKKIPFQSGLGGASSNAASVLLALNKIFKLELKSKELFRIALSLGSDVPIFIHGESCEAFGRGEVFKKISLQEKPILIILPNCKISTKEAFENIGSFNNKPKNKKVYINHFETWARKKHDEINESFLWIEKYNEAFLSGTGSTIFSLFNNFDEATKIMDNAPSNMNCFVTTTLNNSPIKNEIKNYGV